MHGRHSLLSRQIRRHFGGEENIPDNECCRAFLDAVNDAYWQSDADRAMLERSMELSSAELMEANSALRQSLSVLQATLESTADGILVVDLEGRRIVASNRRFAEMWGLPDEVLESGEADQLVTRMMESLKEPKAYLSKVRDLYANPDVESQDVLELKDGRVFERYSQPQRIGGRSVGRVSSFRDVTERRRAEEERARLQLMGAMGHLVGGLAHEVRNPLFAISATLEAVLATLDGTPEQESLRRLLDNLREPTTRLSELMSELLEYGKPLGRDLTPGSLDEVVRQAVRDCQPLAEGRRVQLLLKGNGREHRVAMIRPRLLMAINNLIQNAVQHTPPEGAVVVELSEHVEGDHAWARCSVEDSGPGFRPEDLPRVFEPFFTRRKGGTGLGLSIVQRIAEEQKACIAAANRPEGGAVITLDLPLC
ncbi:MAG TPA: ATP-binding protein [Thermoanaerobaculia bacterium]|nr:ATP-binding protein [Thermoanaerobaculia bacterium]